MMDKDEMYSLLDDLYEDDPGMTDEQLALALGEVGVSRDEAEDAVELWRPPVVDPYEDNDEDYWYDDDDDYGDDYLW